MASDPNLCFGLTLGGERRGQPFDWRDPAPNEPHWVQIDLTHETEAWLLNRGRVDPTVFQALVAEGARPRCAAFDDGVMVVLRGVNQNPGADAEDMVSVRMWIEARRVITVTPRRFGSVLDVRERVQNGRGPSSVGELIVAVATSLVDRLMPSFAELEEDTDHLHEQLVDSDLVDFRTRLANLRRRLIQFRRHLSPQSAALLKLMRDQPGMFPDQYGEQLREACEKSAKFVEDVNAMVERTTYMHDELESRLNERMNRNMEVMSMVAVLFMPMSIVPSMFGMNVGGMPLGDSPYGFYWVMGGLAMVVLAQLLVMRKMKLFHRV